MYSSEGNDRLIYVKMSVQLQYRWVLKMRRNDLLSALKPQPPRYICQNDSIRSAYKFSIHLTRNTGREPQTCYFLTGGGWNISIGSLLCASSPPSSTASSRTRLVPIDSIIACAGFSGTGWRLGLWRRVNTSHPGCAYVVTSCEVYGNLSC